MKRHIIADLIEWKTSRYRKPLLIRGARQVGKTYAVRQFGADHFEQLIEINFEQSKEYAACFDTLIPEEIIKRIYTLSNKKLIPGKTLLFLDEIQETPNAILALRYFYEQMPDIHIIAAGSLLEFTLRQENFRMPVGRVQSMFLYPLSFIEFLMANQQESLIEIIKNANVENGVEAVYHNRLTALLKEYFTIGGMPETVAAHCNGADLRECQKIQSSILEGYRGDFGKYAGKTSIRYLQRVYEKAPGMIGEHFKYVDIDPEGQARDIKPALEDLTDASIVTKIYCASASGLPLINTINEKKFKLLFIDIGLVSQTSALSAEILMQDDLILINRGNLAEQFVGQELLAHAANFEKAKLYYWERTKASSTAEVDYVTNVDSKIIPIEVKAGTTGRLKSLQLFLKEKKSKLGVRISQRPLQLEQNILSLPLYMISELTRIVSMLK